MNAGRLSQVFLQSLGNVVQAADYEEKTHSGDSERRHDVITISREAGAKGTTIARAVGELLGWPVYDRELLDHIGKEMGMHVDMVKLVDEKPMNWLEQCVVGLISEYNLSHDSYMVHLVAAVRGLGAKGNCVIVGRGANFMLPHDRTLNVRLVADLKDRIAYIRAHLNLSEKGAARWVEKTNKQRDDFIKRHFGKDVNDLRHYYLGLNVSRLGVAECAEIIVTTLHQLQTFRLVAQPHQATR